MSNWAETFVGTQQFYKAFDLNNKIEAVDNKTPIVARDDNGMPEGVTSLDNLTAGSVWFIVEEV